MLRACAAAAPGSRERPFWITFVGDSVMRGLFFDVLDVLVNDSSAPFRGRVDRGWGKRVFNGALDSGGAADGRGVQLDFTVPAGGASERAVRVRMQTGSAFNVLASKNVSELRRLLFLDRALWPELPDVLVVGGSVAWDVKFGGLGQYEATMARLARALAGHEQRVIWVAPAAIHGGFGGSCAFCDPKTFAFMNLPRSVLFSTAGTALMRPASAAVVDALAITSAAAGWNAHEHYDALYAPNDGHVSRTIANVVLNTICAARMPAGRRHPTKK